MAQEAALGASNTFCEGDMAMVMYMDGFRWTHKEGNSCLNLYFGTWTLNSKGRLIAAMVGVFFISLLTEAISKFRHNLSLRARDIATPQSERRRIAVFQTFLHGIHAFIGYIIMLATNIFVGVAILCDFWAYDWIFCVWRRELQPHFYESMLRFLGRRSSGKISLRKRKFWRRKSTSTKHITNIRGWELL